MKLTHTMKHELHMSYLGGGGMYVNNRIPLLQTYEGLARRGLMVRKPEEDSTALRFFALTDEGKRHAAELAAPTSARVPDTDASEER